MTNYSGDVEVFAKGQWRTMRARLNGRQRRHQIRSFGETSVVKDREDWSGSLEAADDNAAYAVYDDDADRKVRFPNGQERTFTVSSFSNPLGITGNGSIPWD